MMRLVLLLVALLAACAGLVPAGPALAQSDILQVIRRDYERRQQLQAEEPVRTQPARPRRSKARASPFAAPKAATAEAKPAVVPTVFVHVLGDSLADMLADGLKAQLGDRPDIAVVPRTRGSSGFVRSDYHDWNQSVGELLAGGDKIDAVVMMIGANDRQQIKEEGATLELRSEEWRAAYVKRVDAVLARLKERGLKVFWVGLPPMKNQKLTADMVWFNEIFRERVEAAGGIYVDIWDGFADVNGAYTATGPDLNGQMAKLRAGDGVHFSKAGARLAAHFVERDLRRALGDAPQIAAPSSTVPLAPGAVVTGPLSAADLAPVPGSAAPGEPVEREKPEFGPVLTLDQVEPSPGGTLLGGSPSSAASPPIAGQAPAGQPPAGQPPAGQASAGQADPSAARVLVRGEALAPKEGRADDYRWPRAARPEAAQKTTSRAVPQPTTP